ncbi:MAG: agmatine deiminase family protein [Bryobacter sp.]|nr:agmatine deiminase family protein [Bryobacter sp.]
MGGYLKKYFEQKHLPYRQALERREGVDTCHVYYEPTIPGFRADPDDQGIQELFIDPGVLPFVTNRLNLLGDSYDLASLLLPELRDAHRVVFGMQTGLPKDVYEKSLERRFGGTKHEYTLRAKAWNAANPWTQDYLKSGTVAGQSRILVTYMAYEGKPEPGTRFRPLAESLSDPRFVRSKLAWEGGDLQFVRHPRNPQQTVMFYGNAAAPFWAGEISVDEYEYILMLEFGADVAVNLSEVVDHVDYLAMPVPQEKALLFGKPVRGNLMLALHALDVLEGYYSKEQAPNLVGLGRLLRLPGNPLITKEKELKATIGRARGRVKKWLVGVDQDLVDRVVAYIDKECGGKKEECFEPHQVKRLLEQGDDFVRQWAEAAIFIEDYQSVGTAMLALIESQLPSHTSPRHARIETYAKKLEAMGFRLIRVPMAGFEPSLKPGYAGLSYVNSFVTGRQIFVPSMGFTSFENTAFSKLRIELPGYQITPVFVRHAILHSGGVHCMIGIVREPVANSTE